MRVTQPSGSATKATTATRNRVATAIVGAALISYLVQKSPDARAHLEQVAGQADLTESDATVITQLLARPIH